jgi:hypothetical protein
MNRIKRFINLLNEKYERLSKGEKAGLFLIIGAIITGLCGIIGVIITGLFGLHNPPVVVTLATPITAATNPTGIVPTATYTACPGPADFTFEDGTRGNWVIRYDGTTLMGESLEYSNAVQCNGNPVDSLAFKFQLGTGHGAQVGLDGKGIPLAAGMSAWLYAPKDTPATLAVRCIVMEGESRGYAWYETDPKPLSPGAWVKIDCPYSGFHWVEGGDGKGWQNPPQFIGLGFLDTQDKPYLGTIELTSVDIQ